MEPSSLLTSWKSSDTKTSPKIAEKRLTRQSGESVNGAKVGQNEAKEPSVTTEPSSSIELCLVKPAGDLPSEEPSVLILDKQISKSIAKITSALTRRLLGKSSTARRLTWEVVWTNRSGKKLDFIP
ncbi:hypothetical protein YC2023_076722 [Brassica napus]